MKTYQIWHCKENTGRATEYAFLDSDYDWIGEVEADSPKAVVARLAQSSDNDSELLQNRPLRSGDVLQEDSETAYILTPSGIWASVKVVEEHTLPVDE